MSDLRKAAQAAQERLREAMQGTLTFDAAMQAFNDLAAALVQQQDEQPYTDEIRKAEDEIHAATCALFDGQQSMPADIADALGREAWNLYATDAAHQQDGQPVVNVGGFAQPIRSFHADQVFAAPPAVQQDLELSAALGWPGGISNPVLDRAALLRIVADRCRAAHPAVQPASRPQLANGKPWHPIAECPLCQSPDMAYKCRACESEFTTNKPHEVQPAVPLDDTRRMDWLEAHAVEQYVRPQTLSSEVPDERRYWALPQLQSYNCIGASFSVREAIDIECGIGKEGGDE